MDYKRQRDKERQNQTEGKGRENYRDNNKETGERKQNKRMKHRK